VVIPIVCNGTDVVIWRSASGKVNAWNDRCQHRGMRLSHGFVRGERLSCIYHGWTYDTGGVCKFIPAHPDLTPPEAIRAEAFSCVESRDLVWVAASDIQTLPPDVGRLAPVRSFVIAGTVAKLQQALPSDFELFEDTILRGRVTLANREISIALVLQSPADGRLRTHALSEPTDDASDLIAISRWLEDIRRTVETGTAT
jgi:nitrite reductase/ring-hydroxylating ferredoxin subunit